MAVATTTAKRLVPVQDDVPPPICVALREAREAARISQVELALSLGVTQSHISRWEREREPSLDDISRLEAALNVTPGHLLRKAGYVVDPRSGDDLVRYTIERLGISPDYAGMIQDLFRAAERRTNEDKR